MIWQKEIFRFRDEKVQVELNISCMLKKLCKYDKLFRPLFNEALSNGTKVNDPVN